MSELWLGLLWPIICFGLGFLFGLLAGVKIKKGD